MKKMERGRSGSNGMDVVLHGIRARSLYGNMKRDDERKQGCCNPAIEEVC